MKSSLGSPQGRRCLLSLGPPTRAPGVVWLATCKAPPAFPLRLSRFWQRLTCNCWSRLVSCKFPTFGNGEEQKLGGQLGNRQALWLESETGQEMQLRQEGAETHTPMTGVQTHATVSLASHPQWEGQEAPFPKLCYSQPKSPPLAPLQS